jgi:hypothetical protein
MIENALPTSTPVQNMRFRLRASRTQEEDHRWPRGSRLEPWLIETMTACLSFQAILALWQSTWSQSLRQSTAYQLGYAESGTPTGRAGAATNTSAHTACRTPTLVGVARPRSTSAMQFRPSTTRTSRIVGGRKARAATPVGGVATPVEEEKDGIDPPWRKQLR